MDTFQELKVGDYALSSQSVREGLEHISRSDKGGTFAANHVRQYYKNGGPLLWVNFQGVSRSADTLLHVLETRLPAIGFSTASFRLGKIREDMERLRSLQFDGQNPISTVVARLEYNLTRAYLTYAIGQRYGFVNPTYVLNRYEARDQDSTGRAITYRHLYDVDIERPSNDDMPDILSHIAADGLGGYLRQAEPTDSLYLRLLHKLTKAGEEQASCIRVNMERCRWRGKQKPTEGQKFVVVNIPAFHLWAFSPDTIIDMRAACGAVKTKTPLLSSEINLMQVNPEWVIPMSIIRDDVARHAGDSSYFARNNYYIADRKTGKRLSPRQVTAGMLRSGGYRVAQEGGAGNSLGRIIFRFPNNFSVFMHDTSSPGVFKRDNRGVSHGCVRVQRPFDLAVFMMGRDPDPELLDKLRISMGMMPETEWGHDMLDSLDPAVKTPRLVRALSVSPRVPIYFIYYTMYLLPDGTLQQYGDVYGYDKVIDEALKTYV